MQKLIFVTQNQDKIDDAKKLLSDFDIQPVSFDVPEVQSMDPKEIVSKKLKYAYEQIQEPCFVMDTSLFMDCLNGFPGPFIKFWFSETVGPEKTCAIANLFKEYGCQYTNSLGYYDGENEHFFEETLEGEISTERKGENGYQWDDIFIPKGDTRTFAEMNFEEKQSYAPQAKLLAQLKAFLDK